MRRTWCRRISKREKCTKKETLCWKCAKACGGCSWSSRAHKPVTGWTAERRDLYIQNSSVPVESYVVYDCPEYVSDGREHGEAKYSAPPLPESMVEEIISLRENTGLSYEKIAERLGISQQTVRKYYHTRTGGAHIRKNGIYKDGHTCMIRGKELTSGDKSQELGGLKAYTAEYGWRIQDGKVDPS